MNSKEKIKPATIPQHLAIIMDGNGRWAEKRMLSRIKGHERGALVIKEIIDCCCELGIPVLTLYAFSTENWKRPASEISGLMKILVSFLNSEQQLLLNKDIRLSAIGQLHRLPSKVEQILCSVINITSKNKGMRLNLALSYGGRSDITNMVIRIATEAKKNVLDLKAITPDLISNYLSTHEFTDPDVLIRTGGEIRISNFLLWQIAYTELFFTETLWPDFGVKEFTQIIKEFPKRKRRFGSVVI